MKTAYVIEGEDIMLNKSFKIIVEASSEDLANHIVNHIFSSLSRLFSNLTIRKSVLVESFVPSGWRAK